MEFSWDSRKALANRKKHGVSFEAARLVFLDPKHIELLDDRFDEPRWSAIGVAGSDLLTVGYAVWNEEVELIRVITARRASAKERQVYRENVT